MNNGDIAHNHISDGWHDGRAPTPRTEEQRRAWFDATWVKQYGHLENGVVRLAIDESLGRNDASV